MSYTDSRSDIYTPISFNSEPVDIVEYERNLTSYNKRFTKYDSTVGGIIKSASTSLSALPGFASSLSSLKISPEYIVKLPIYSDQYNDRLSNAFLFDDVINTALVKLSYFTLGTSDEIRSILYPESVRPLKSELEAKNALKEIQVMKNALGIADSIVSSYLSDQEIDQFEKYILYTHKIAKLGSFLRKNHIAGHVFARSASYIEYTDNGIPELGIPPGSPIGLKPLKSQLLGSVILDKETWQLKAVEYRDPTLNFKEYVDLGVKEQLSKATTSSTTGMTINDINSNNKQTRFFDADNVLYFVKNNYNMERDDDGYWFGHSTLQSILPLSEENRRINSIVIPQLNQALWAGTGIWFFPNWTKSQMENFFSAIKPGGHIGVGNDQIKFQQITLDYDYQGLLNLKNELKRQMMSAFSIPSFLMNFENVTNRATADKVLVGFNESTIQAERGWISDILDDQWYPKLFRAYWPHDDFMHIKMKIHIEFSNIEFESFLEKAVAGVSLVEQGIITLTELRNMLKLPPLLPEDYAALGLKPPIDLMGGQQFEAVQTPNLVAQLGAMNQKKQQMTGSGSSSTTGGGVNKSELANKAGLGGSSGTTLASIKSQLLAD